MKFTPEKSLFPKNFAGFWKPKEGDIVRGVIRDAFDGEYGKTFMIELAKNEFGAATPLVVEQRDRETHVKSDYTAKAGEHVGVNEKANLKGLGNFVGHAVNIRYLGLRDGDRAGTTIHEFDTDIGAKVAPKEEKATTATSKSARA